MSEPESDSLSESVSTALLRFDMLTDITVLLLDNCGNY